MKYIKTYTICRVIFSLSVLCLKGCKMKTKIEYAKQIKEMYEDIKYIMRKTCEISELPEQKQKELYSKILDIWYILYHNQNLTEDYKKNILKHDWCCQICGGNHTEEQHNSEVQK